MLDQSLDQFDYYYSVKMPDLTEYRNFTRIVICGMGGSSFPADIVADHVKEVYKRDFISVCRDYKLPFYVDENTLVIAASFSGSTEETLSCMKEAMDRKIPLVGISMGGEISRLCSENNIPYISLPKVTMPRFGAGYMISALFRVLSDTKLIPQQDEEINNIKILLSPVSIYAKKTAEGIAKKIKNRIVTIYSDVEMSSAGNVARICINETAKVFGYHAELSECNHNELACLEITPHSHAFLLLTYPTMHKRITQRFEVMRELLSKSDIIYEKVNANFDKILLKDVYFIMFFSYLGYFLAIESDHDPIGTPTQDAIKMILKQKFGALE